MKKIILGISLAVSATVVVALVSDRTPGNRNIGEISATSDAVQAPQDLAALDQQADITHLSEHAADDDTLQLKINELALELLDAYGANIRDLRVQARLIEVRARLLAEFPGQGAEIFDKAIAIAFPELAADILRLVDRMAEYEEWLADNHLSLSEMALLQKQGALWQKRRQLFGSDADVIWAEEQQAWARKQQNMKKVIVELDQSSQLSLDETLYQLESSLNETYGSGIERLALDHGVVAQVYFGFESVQSKLRNMTAEARQQEINRLRTSLGYSEEQVANLQRRDEKRETRWQNGYAYMAERDALVARLSGAELESALGDLRKTYFKHEAKTIALEEGDGFFRYERPRLYGRN